MGTGTSYIKAVVFFSNLAVGLGANLVAQSALLAGAGLLVAWTLRHKRAALRSVVLRATLAAILLCPWVSLGLRALGVRGLTFTLPRATVRQVAVPTRLPPLEQSLSEPVEFPSGNEQHALPLGVSDRSEAVLAGRPAQSGEALPPAPPASSTPSASGLCLVYFTLTALWLMVSGLLLLRLLIAHGWILRVRRRAQQSPRPLCAACHALAHEMGVSPPRLLTTPLVRSPCLTGLVRPALLLPQSENAADAVSMDGVILHELAHLARRDCLWNLLGRVAGAVLFFQPLVWRLARRIEDASDEVADDYVVHHETDRRRYACLLVDMAERFQPTPSEGLAGVGVIFFMSSLERRVLRILDTTRELSLHTGMRAVVAVVALTVCGTVAASLVGAGANAGRDPGAEELLRTAVGLREVGAYYHDRKEDWQAAEILPEAVDILERLTREFEMDSAEASAIYARGVKYLSLRAYEEAMADFSAAIELEPDYKHAWEQRAAS